MNPALHQEITSLGNWTLALGILAGWVIVGVILVHLGLILLRRATARSMNQMENMLVRALPAPAYVLVLICGVMVASHFAPFLAVDEARVLRALDVLLMAAGVYLAASVLGGLLRDLENRYEALKSSHVLFSAILHIGVWILGAMMILENLGVSITPLIASLGVGSLAVALALQPALANLFSGLYILLDKPVRAGDFVQLSSGEEGHVQSVGWHSTQVRLLANNVVVIPNSKLIEGRILNYHLPEKECSVSVQVGVDYASDLRQVERVTIEVGLEAQKEVPGAVKDFTPFIRYHTFADSSINFTVILRTSEFVDHYLLKHEFIKKLHERYRVEGISIPFPIRTLHMAAPAALSKEP